MDDQTITAPPDTVNVTAPPPAPAQDSQTAPDPSQAITIQPTPQPAYDTPQRPYTPPGLDPNTDPEVHAGAVSHARSADVLGGILRAMAGPRSYKAITNQDGSVDVHELPSTRGEQWRRVLGAALEGASKGFAAGQGPGGMAHAASAGIDAGMQMPYQQADMVRAQAKDANDQNRAKLLFNANMAMLDQKIIQAKNENQRDGVLFPLQMQEASLAWAKALRDIGAVRSTSFKDNEGMAQQLTPQNLQAHLGTNGIFIPQTTYKDNMADSIDGWILPEDKRAQLNDTRIEIPRMKPDPDKPGKYLPDTPFVIEPHSMTNQDIAGAVKGVHDSQTEMVTKGWTSLNAAQETQQKQDRLPSEIAQARGAAAASFGEAALKGKQTEMLGKTISNQPGGVPVEVTDPDFPAQSNFPVGTPGIAIRPKSGDYKVSADSAKAERLGQLMSDGADIIRQTANNNPQLFGKLRGLLSQGKTLAGLSDSKDDKALATLAGAVQSYGAASAAYHTFRNVKMPAETAESMLRDFRNKPGAINAYLDSQTPMIKDAQRIVRNYEMYGTPDGPSKEARAAAVARAPNAAQFAGGGTPNPNPNPNPANPNAAIQAPQGATITYHDQAGNVTGWAVGGQYVPLVKKPQQ
jgi:hypothetical protein